MDTRIETRLTRDYGLRHPVALAPMAFVGTAPDLAIAVCQAGGLGSLAVGPLPAETIRALINAVKSATAGPLNVNFITFLATRTQIQACIDEAVAVVSFHWGHPPRELVAALHEAGIRVWEQVGSVEAARNAVDGGIDLIVAQGSEAGGHNYGSLPTFVLVPAIVEAVAPKARPPALQPDAGPRRGSGARVRRGRGDGVQEPRSRADHRNHEAGRRDDPSASVHELSAHA